MVLNADDKAWDEYLDRLPREKQDIYYSSSYYRMAEKQSSGKAQMFVYENQKGQFGIYPFLKTEIQESDIEDKFYDIETAYGYGGPITNNDDKEFNQAFDEAFREYCKRENIVAEFVRFHPLLQNEGVFETGMRVEHNRITVWLDLEKEEENIWKEDISTKNRNVIRSCQKKGLFVKETKDYESFQTLYNDTMDKVGAASFYYFKEEYYQELSEDEHYILLNVFEDEEVIASAIFIKYGEYFHYHLAGSKKEKLKLAPNNLLLWSAILYAKEQGCKKLHFGGGLTDSQEDSLFQFKKKFSSTIAHFYIGKRIHNKEIYEKLILNWEKKHQSKAKLFLQYKNN